MDQAPELLESGLADISDVYSSEDSDSESDAEVAEKKVAKRAAKKASKTAKKQVKAAKKQHKKALKAHKKNVKKAIEDGQTEPETPTELSEATNKALDSNNYISTRIDDILSKLHGAMETKDLDLTGRSQPPVTSPEVEAVKNKLQTQQEKDNLRKELRKQKQDEDLDMSAKETPDLEVQEDLSEPVAPAAPPPATPAPAAPPPAPPAV